MRLWWAGQRSAAICEACLIRTSGRPGTSTAFRRKVTGGRVTINDEVRDFWWVTADEINSRVNEAFAVRITDALANSSAPAIRQHDRLDVRQIGFA
jgi:hypothetical protein